MGVPADEIHVIRVDGSEDLVDKWNTFVEYDSVQSLEFYTHGTSGHIEPYGGINDSIFTDGTLGNLNWKKDKNGRAPQIVMYGCHTAGESGNKSNTTQNIANYFGVEVHGNMLNTSFSKEKTVFKRIDEWTTSNDVYLATYGTYDDKSFWFNEDQAFSYLYQRFCGKVLGRDRCPMTTFYPKCSE